MTPRVTASLGARRFARDESGAAMVEFAFVALLLFTFMFAIIDFGRALYLYNNLTNAAREGARFGATQFPNPCGATPAIIERTASRIREFNNDPDANPAGYVTVACEVPAGTTIPSRVTVTITGYPFRAITPLPYLQTLTLGSQAIPINSMVRFEGALDP